MRCSPVCERVLAVLGRALGLAILLAVLGGGCTFVYRSDHDDDPPPCPDPFGGCNEPATYEPTVPELDSLAYRLASYRLDAPEPWIPDRHPVLRVTDVAGLSLLELWGPTLFGEAGVVAFSEHVREANPELLGLPPRAGALRARGVELVDPLLLVGFDQLPPWSAEPLAGAEQVFVFDLQGRLLRIENDLWVPPGARPSGKLR